MNAAHEVTQGEVRRTQHEPVVDAVRMSDVLCLFLGTDCSAGLGRFFYFYRRTCFTFFLLLYL